MEAETVAEMNAVLPSQKKLLGLASQIASYKRALTPDEVAELLGLGKVTILRWARASRIPSFKLGAQVRFDPRLLAEWVKLARGDPRATKRR